MATTRIFRVGWASRIFDFKDTHSEKGTLKLNSSAYEKYEYGHLGRWYIKVTLFKKFYNWNQFSKEIK